MLNITNLFKNKNKFDVKQLQRIEAEIPWDMLVDMIIPHYLSSSIGRFIVPLETMLRVHFLQLYYEMTGIEVEDALNKKDALRALLIIFYSNGWLFRLKLL